MTPRFSYGKVFVRVTVTPWNSLFDKLFVFLWSKLSKSLVVKTPDHMLVGKTTPSSSTLLHTLRTTAIFISCTRSFDTDKTTQGVVHLNKVLETCITVHFYSNVNRECSFSFFLWLIWTTFSDGGVYSTILNMISWDRPHATLVRFIVPLRLTRPFHISFGTL